MLDKVTKKAYHGLTVTDTLGVKHDMKVLNFTASGARTSKLDRQCVVDTDTTIIEGMELNLLDGKVLIVSYKQADIYQNAIIRYILDCTEASYRVSFIRTVTSKSKQGGLSGQTDTVVYTNIPVKIGMTDAPEVNKLDEAVPSFVMYLSKNYTLLKGDRIVISDSTFEVAKVDSFVHVTPGLMEVRFDKDPRWV
jgi:putative ribosome biogenesis GTPase RsgA